MVSGPKGTVGWGLVGASTIAREWVINAIHEAGGRAGTVMSRDPERAATYARDTGIKRSTGSLDELLQDDEVDAVYISTTNERHHAEALAAAAAGKHVLCEKPLALNLTDAEEMVRACEERGLVFATNHHLRNAASHRMIRDFVQNGAIGTVHAMRIFHAVYLPEHLQTWRIDRPECGGGIFLDISVHDADTTRFILEDEPVDVVAQSGSFGLGTNGLDDAVMYVMRMGAGALVQVHESFVTRHAGTGLEVHGSDGSIFAQDVMTQRPAGTVTLQRNKTRDSISVAHEDLYARAIRRFHGAIRGEDDPSATGWDGVRSLAIALAVEEAARTGERARVSSAGLRGAR